VSDIFISYAREDEPRVQALVAAFEAQGWSVFWDRRIPAGRTWRDHIGSALQQARCIVVAWSATSVASQWVAEEADEGRVRQVLVPVLLEAVQPPRGFREIQAADLSAWRAGEPSARLDELIADLHRLLGPAMPAEGRPESVRPPSPDRTTLASAGTPTTPHRASGAATAAAGPGARRTLVLGASALALAAAAGGTYLAMSRSGPAWVVVAGSFAPGESAAADRRRQQLAAAGLDARVADSRQYPLLAPNLLVVLVGPFDRADEAEAATRRARAVVPDAYAKQAR
jgi:hypothetical protein